MISEDIDGVSEQPARDNVSGIPAFPEKENQQAREHEMKLFSLFTNRYQNHHPYHMLTNMTSEAIDDRSEQLTRDNASDIPAFLEKENQQAREHEMKLSCHCDF